MLCLVGFPNPVTFGLLVAVLNYIPYIGPAIFAVVLFCVGLVAMPALAQAALAPALFVAIATFEGHFITPSIVGKRLPLSPFLVFLALVFWTWLWGPIGPHSHVQNTSARNTRNGLSGSRLPTMLGVMKWPSNVAIATNSAGASAACA